MEASNEFWRREPTLLAIFAAKGPAAIEFRCGDAAMTEKSYQPSRESGECRITAVFATPAVLKSSQSRSIWRVCRNGRAKSKSHNPAITENSRCYGVKDAPVFNRTEVTEAASLENRPRMMLSMRVRFWSMPLSSA
jgi:hypothetical protein